MSLCIYLSPDVPYSGVFRTLHLCLLAKGQRTYFDSCFMWSHNFLYVATWHLLRLNLVYFSLVTMLCLCSARGFRHSWLGLGKISQFGPKNMCFGRHDHGRRRCHTKKVENVPRCPQKHPVVRLKVTMWALGTNVHLGWTCGLQKC